MMWHPCFTRSMCCESCPVLAQAPSVQPCRQPRRRKRTLGGVLKAAVLDGAQQLGLEQEVLEAAAVDAHVALLHLQQKGKRSASMVLQASPRTATQACAADKGAHCRGCKTVPFAPGRPPWRPPRPWPPHLPPHSQAAAAVEGSGAKRRARRENEKRQVAAGAARRVCTGRSSWIAPSACCRGRTRRQKRARTSTSRQRQERAEGSPSGLSAAASCYPTGEAALWDSPGPCQSARRPASPRAALIGARRSPAACSLTSSSPAGG